MLSRTERYTRVRSAEPVDEPVVERHEVEQTVPGDGYVAHRGLTAGEIAARVIWYLTGLLLILLAFRFVFALLGANTANGLANFIYSVSYPFVAPFFSLFHYSSVSYGYSRFELYTLVAMAIYAVIGWGLTKLCTLSRPRY